MAALPPSFLNPGASAGAIFMASASLLHACADLYVGQNAVLAVTISGGPAGAFAAAAPPLAGGGVDCEHPARSSTATTAAPAEHRLTRVPMRPPTRIEL